MFPVIKSSSWGWILESPSTTAPLATSALPYRDPPSTWHESALLPLPLFSYNDSHPLLYMRLFKNPLHSLIISSRYLFCLLLSSQLLFIFLRGHSDSGRNGDVCCVVSKNVKNLSSAIYL